MTKDKALKLALKAFEANNNYLGSLDFSEEIIAIKEALAQPDHIVDANKMAQPAQEPWMYRIWNDKDAQWRLTDDCSWPAEPIYTTPQLPEPRNFCSRCGKRTADLTVIHTCTPPEGGHQ